MPDTFPGDFGSAIDESIRFRNEENARLVKANLLTGGDATPEAEATYQKYAKQAGIPVEAVKAAPDVVRRELEASTFDAEAYARDHPSTTLFLSDPNNSRLLGPDYAHMSHMERLTLGLFDHAKPVSEIRNQPEKNRLRDVGTTAMKALSTAADASVGTLDLLGGLTGLNYLFNTSAGELYKSLGIDPGQTSRILQGRFSPDVQGDIARQQNADGAAATYSAIFNSSPYAIGSMAVEQLPSQFLMSPLAKLARTVAPITRLTSAGVGEGLVSAGGNAEQIRQAHDDGKFTALDYLAMTGMTATTGSVTMLGGKIAQKGKFADFDALMAGGKAPGTASVMGTLAGVATEAGEEGVQSYTEQMWQNLATGRPLTEGAASAAASGSVLGGLMGGGISALHAARALPGASSEYQAEARADEAKYNAMEKWNNLIVKTVAKDVDAVNAARGVDQLAALGQAARDNPLSKVYPERMHQFIQEMDDASGTPTDLFVDQKVLEEAFAQSGLKPEEIQKLVPDVVEQMQSNSELDGMVRVSPADFIAHISTMGDGSVAAAVLPHTLIGENRSTLAEAQAHAAAAEGYFKTEAERIVAESQPVLTREEFMKEQEAEASVTISPEQATARVEALTKCLG